MWSEFRLAASDNHGRFHRTTQRWIGVWLGKVFKQSAKPSCQHTSFPPQEWIASPRNILCNQQHTPPPQVTGPGQLLHQSRARATLGTTLLLLYPSAHAPENSASVPSPAAGSWPGLPLWLLREGVLPQVRAEDSHAHAHGIQTAAVQSLRQVVQRSEQHEEAREAARGGGQRPRVCALRTQLRALPRAAESPQVQAPPDPAPLATTTRGGTLPRAAESPQVQAPPDPAPLATTTRGGPYRGLLSHLKSKHPQTPHL